MEDSLLSQTDYMSVFNTLRAEVEKLKDVKRLTQVKDSTVKYTRRSWRACPNGTDMAVSTKNFTVFLGKAECFRATKRLKCL